MEKRAMAVREEQWIQTIAAAKQSGQPIKVWCAEHGVPVSSFYKWQRKMRDSLLAEEIFGSGETNLQVSGVRNQI